MKDTKKILGYFSIILIIAVLFIVGILLGRDKKGFLNLPNTGEDTKPNIYLEAEEDLASLINTYDYKGEIDPWYQEQPKKDSLSMPSADALFEIYKKISEAYANRDLNLFKEYASTERIFHISNPKTNAKADYKGTSVFILEDMDAEENFINNSLLLCHLKAPSTNLLTPIEATWETTQYQVGGAYILDPIKKEYVLLDVDNWQNRAILKLEIIPNDYVFGSGVITFVYDKGNWKYHFEVWDINYSEVSSIGDIEDNSNKIILDDEIPKTLTIQVDTQVQWPILKGYIYTKSGSIEHWSSGYINNTEYIKSFNKKGVYKYTILNKLYEEVFNGEIIVN